MIKYDNEQIEMDCDDVSQLMQETSMIVLGVLRRVKEALPDDVPLDFLVQDLFKSLRYVSLLEDGMSEEQALEVLNGTKEVHPKIELD